MDSYLLIVILSGIVIVSYFFDIISRSIKIPSVILLLILGVLMGEYMRAQQIDYSAITALLPTLGSFGLILIVLEGALDLDITKENRSTAIKTLITALVMLIATTLAIAFFFEFYYDLSRDIALINAVPFSVISSAVAIPSVDGLIRRKKEFIIFESTYSDILAIMLFNFLAANAVLDSKAYINLFQTSLFTIIGSVVGTIALMYMMYRIKYHLKFFLIIAILTFVFALGKMYHLSTLMIIFFFGLMLNNYQNIIPKNIVERLHGESLEKEIDFMTLITAESAFVIRTFFFIIFGITIHIENLLNADLLFAAFLILMIIYTIRFLLLLVADSRHLFPETFIAPRGLITILLVMTIPAAKVTSQFDGNLSLAVIVASLIIMTISNIFTPKGKGVNLTESSTPFIGPITEEEYMDNVKSE